MSKDNSASNDGGDNAATMTTVDLNLDGDEAHLRRLCPFGDDGQFLAYGGDDGTINLVFCTDASAIDDGNTMEVRPVRREDDDFIRALAVSPNGKRIAVGYDSGLIRVFAYDDYDQKRNDRLEHPFAAKLQNASCSPSAQTQDDNLFSQSDNLPGLDTPRSGERIISGPSFETSVRDLQFYPTSSEDNYWLAIATESGFSVVNAYSDETISKVPRYLEEEAEEAHGDSGVRSVAFGRINDSQVLLASLAMDGRLCVWDCSKSTSPAEWKLLQREDQKAVSKADMGDLLSDPFDRACAPHFDAPRRRLFLPGELFLQIRRFPEKSDHDDASSSLKMITCDQPSSTTENSKKDDDPSALPYKGHLESIVCLATSPPNEQDDQEYLVTSGRDGRVILWKLLTDSNDSDADNNDGTLTAQWVRQLTQLESAPTHMVWCSQGAGNESIHMACLNGTMVSIQGRGNICPKPTTLSSKKDDKVAAKMSSLESSPSPASTTMANKAESPLSPQTKSLSKKSEKENDVEDSDDDILFDDNNSSADNDDPSSKRNNKFILDEAADDDDEDSVTNAPPQQDDKAATSLPDTNESPTVDNFDGGFDDDYDNNDLMDSEAPNRQYKVDLPKPQPAFAPSSTPLDLTRRFMCWNHIGSITHMQSDDGSSRSSVDVNFTDSAFRRPISFTDNLGFILGSLGEDGGIFATDLADDDDDLDDVADDDDVVNVVKGLSATTKAALKRSQKARMRMSKGGGIKPTGSTVYFHRYETFGALRDKDWYLTLPDGERALGCACGEGWAAVMTSRRFLRLFSSGGNQDKVLWLTGEPVTMAGHGRFLTVFYHESIPLEDGTQKLAYIHICFDAGSSCVISKGPVSCITTGSSLSWAGFSNDSSPMAMDSDGMVSMLVCSSSAAGQEFPPSWEWMPMLDTVGLRKSSEDNFWPVTVYDGKLVCVPLKGGTQHPNAARRPVTTALNLRLPLARGTVTKNNALEELSIRANIALSQKKVMQDLSEGVDESFEKEYHTLSAQVDKVTLKMFAATVEAGKLERALDLVEKLHLEKSFDLAMRIADAHRKLVDLIEDAKDRKFGVPDDQSYEDDYETSQEFSEEQSDKPLRRISPDASSSRKGKRSFNAPEGLVRQGRRVRQRDVNA